MSKKLLVTGLLLSGLFCGVFLLNAGAQTVPMTDPQIELIRNNCASSKSTLNQLHSSDALLRVNIGQIYESMSAKLMEKFNIRVMNNSLNNTNLAVATTNYSLLLEVFRADYMIYEKQLSIAMRVDCNVQPVAFYDAVALARTNRNQIHDDVIKLNQSLAQYIVALDQFGIDNQTKLQEGIK